MPKVVVLPGDGVGPEVVSCALQVLNKLAPDLEYSEFAFGLAGTTKPLGSESFEWCSPFVELLQTSVCT